MGALRKVFRLILEFNNPLYCGGCKGHPCHVVIALFWRFTSWWAVMRKGYWCLLVLSDRLYCRGKARDITIILPLFCFAYTQACGRTNEGLPVDTGVEWPPLLCGIARDMPGTCLSCFHCFVLQIHKLVGGYEEGLLVPAGVEWPSLL